MHNFNTLAGLCSWPDRFRSYLVGNPEDRFSRDEAHLVSYLCRRTDPSFTLTAAYVSTTFLHMTRSSKTFRFHSAHLIDSAKMIEDIPTGYKTQIKYIWLIWNRPNHDSHIARVLLSRSWGTIEC